MKDMLETEIDGALKEIINLPQRPDEALLERIGPEAKRRAKVRQRAAALLAAAASLMLNAVLAFLLVLRTAEATGGGWPAAAAILAGLMLVMLPSVLLLSAGDLPGNIKKHK